MSDTQGEGTTQLDFDALPEVPDGSSFGAEWWLAVGHLRSGNSEAFLGLVTIISIVAVMTGVALLDSVLAVMTGFELDLRDKILGANAHMVVMQYGGQIDLEASDALAKLEAVDGVVSAAPFIYSEMMLRSRYGSSGVVFKGIDPERTGLVTEVRDQLMLGIGGELVQPAEKARVFSALAEPFPGTEEGDKPLPGIFIGDELMESLQVLPGDTVQVLNPVGSSGGPLGMPTPTARMFRVAAIFHSGMYEYDTKWTYVSNQEAQTFLKVEGVGGIEVRVDDIDDVERITAEIESALGYPFYARHWRNMNQSLFEALALEKVVMGFILGMVVVIAGLLIVSNLYTLVLTKRREIAILKAMGASSGSIQRVFVLVGTVIGLVGTGLGTIFGLLICEGLRRYEYPLETDVYYLSSLPVVVEPMNVVIVAVVALLVCFVSTLYPALRAASLDPVEGLRYE